MPLFLEGLLDSPLPTGTKGLPDPNAGLTVAEIGAKGWNLLAGDLPMPVAVLKSAALHSNLQTMQAYLDKAGVRFAPHGKTTLSPQLFERQLDAGAWGITVASVSQLALCHGVGVPRVLMANELVGLAEIAEFARLCQAAPNARYYTLVDSVTGAKQLDAALAVHPGEPIARVLIEVGHPGGRCGVRSLEQARGLAAAVADLPQLRLCGVEGYEGLVVTNDAKADAARVSAYIDTLVAVTLELERGGLFAFGEEILVTAGGSVFFDLVAGLLGRERPHITPVVRSGCYVTHDVGFYRAALRHVHERGPAPEFAPALEVWARVLSTPEPGLAILSAGKRDVSYDIDLPQPLSWIRAGLHDAPQPLQGFHVTKLSDQHAFLQGEGTARLAVGDLVALGISHPCTTFDRWPLLLEVDETYTVTGAVRTFF